MAVCGRCLICGHKFDGRSDDGIAHDEAVRWECASEHPTCIHDARQMAMSFNEIHEHAICTGCHDVLVSPELPSAVTDLLNLVRARTTSS